MHGILVKTYHCNIFQIQDEKTLIGKGLFKRETKIQSFIGLKITLSTGKSLGAPLYLLYMYNNTDALILGEEGVIEGAFGTTGKFRLNMPGKESFSLYCV